MCHGQRRTVASLARRSANAVRSVLPQLQLRCAGLAPASSSRAVAVAYCERVSRRGSPTPVHAVSGARPTRRKDQHFVSQGLAFWTLPPSRGVSQISLRPAVSRPSPRSPRLTQRSSRTSSSTAGSVRHSRSSKPCSDPEMKRVPERSEGRSRTPRLAQRFSCI